MELAQETVSKWIKGLNQRQRKALGYIKEHGKITNREYQALNSITKATATRDLRNLVKENVIKRIGTGKRDAAYVLEPKMSQKTL